MNTLLGTSSKACEGLAAAQTINVCHGDLHPGNLVVNEENDHLTIVYWKLAVRHEQEYRNVAGLWHLHQLRCCSTLLLQLSASICSIMTWRVWHILKNDIINIDYTLMQLIYIYAYKRTGLSWWNKYSTPSTILQPRKIQFIIQMIYTNTLSRFLYVH